MRGIARVSLFRAAKDLGYVVDVLDNGYAPTRLQLLGKHCVRATGSLGHLD